MDQNVLKVKCPTCKKEMIYSTENIFRPFCSERCKLIDLGKWADEVFKVPVENTYVEEFSDNEEDESQ